MLQSFALTTWLHGLKVGIEGLVRASFDALVSAEGSCAMVAERRLLGPLNSKVLFIVQ